MRKWIVKTLIIVMLVVAFVGTIVASTQKKDAPDDSSTISSLFV